MKNEKIITHVELQINPEFINEVLVQAIATKDKILLEDGCEAFHLTTKKENINTLIIFAIYVSQHTYEWHLQQNYVKDFFKFLEGKLVQAPTVNYLSQI